MTDKKEMTDEEEIPSWFIYQHTDKKLAKGELVEPHDDITKKLPNPPKWRTFDDEATEELGESYPANDWQKKDKERAETFLIDKEAAEIINTALFLRRPLLITGAAGRGKSSLAYSVAYQLQLGPVLRWSITSRSTVQDGLYRYDAIGRLHEVSLAVKLREVSLAVELLTRQGNNEANTTDKKSPDINQLEESIGKYLTLGPLGTALLPTKYPRVLLIDEIDKSDIDFPNDLLNIFEEGEYEIPELVRLEQEKVKVRYHDGSHKELVTITNGKVRCNAFPFVVLTSNGERDFPPAFLRRCLRLNMPDKLKLEDLKRIIQIRFPSLNLESGRFGDIITQFFEKQKKGQLANDQLLNAVYVLGKSKEQLTKEAIDKIFLDLNTGS